jgi:starch-binding outer membrane protein, SusD/RagB family
MKNKHIYNILFGLMIFLTGGCKKFLQTPVTNRIVINDIFKDFEGARITLFGCYNNFRSSEYYMMVFNMYPEVAGGNVKYAKTANPSLTNIYNFTNANSIEYNDMAGFYQKAYATIYAANNILFYVDSIADASVAQKNRFIAEAYAIRALVHFDLVRVFAQSYSYTNNAGHVGIVIKTKIDDVMQATPAPSTVKQVFNQIIADFDSSLVYFNKSVPIVGEDKTVLSSNAANALLAKVYLYKGDWENAYRIASTLINSNAYPLLSNAQYISSWSNKTISSESIFEIAFGSGTGGALGDYFNPLVKDNNYLQFAATTDLLSLFDPNDVRGISKMFKDTVFDNRQAFFAKKYFGTRDTSNNIKVIRSSELYLIAAEAAAELGNLDVAASNLNTIRKRANPSATTFTATSKGALIDEILNERRRELCFEGNLFFDIARRKKNLVRIDCTSENASFNYPNSRFACPIPQSQ